MPNQPIKYGEMLAEELERQRKPLVIEPGAIKAYPAQLAEVLRDKTKPVTLPNTEILKLITLLRGFRDEESINETQAAGRGMDDSAEYHENRRIDFDACIVALELEIVNRSSVKHEVPSFEGVFEAFDRWYWDKYRHHPPKMESGEFYEFLKLNGIVK